MSSLGGLDAAVMAFDAAQSELAMSTGDGRVKLFSTAHQRLTADITQTLSAATSGPGSMATEIYSCMAWGPKGSHQRLLFLGTLTGIVCCYNAAKAEVQWTSTGAVDGSIASIACSPDGAGGLLIVGKTGGAAVLDPASGGVLSRWKASKHALSRAVALPGGTAIVAGSSLSLHDAGSGARLHKWTGHATQVAALAATPDGAYCCSSAEGERTAAVWSTATTPDGKLRSKSSVAQLNLEQPATNLAVAQVSADRFHVVAVTSSGALSVFECVSDSNGGLSARRWATSGAGSGAVLCAAIEGADSSGASVVLATGNKAKPNIQSARINKLEGDAVTQVAVAAPEAGLLLTTKAAEGPGAQQKQRVPNGPAAVLGPDENVVLAGRSLGKRGASDAALDINNDADMESAAAAAAAAAAAMEEEGEEGPTFAERIAALQQGNGVDALGGGGGGGVTAAAQNDELSGPVKADSLAVLLTQALQSGDRVLLERCLAVRKEDIINKTVRRLAPADAAAFLRATVQRLQSSPARGDQLALWIRAVLLHHTAYLSGVAGAQGVLGHLYQLIESRLASYQPLLALNGRLDLVLANAQRAAVAADEDEDEHGGLGNGPLVTIHVGSDDGIEVEDAFAAAGLSSGDDESDFSSDDENDSDGDGGSELDDQADEDSSDDE